MNEILQAELKLYINLRQEIADSIKLQHNTFFSGSLLISLIFSVGLRFLPNDLQTTSSDSFYYLGNILILSIPPITIAFSAMWLIEQSRLMRAGNYLELLEDKINKDLGKPCITWENWLRRVGDISMLDIHRIHYIAQCMIMILFLLIGIGAIMLMQSLNISEVIRIGLTIIYLISIIILFGLVFKAIKHRSSKVENISAQGNKEAFSDWEKAYFKELWKYDQKPKGS